MNRADALDSYAHLVGAVLAVLLLLAIAGCDIFVDCRGGDCPEVLIVHQYKTTTTSPDTNASIPLVP